MEYKTLPGVYDILPFDSKEPWRSSSLWQFLESLIRETAAQYGYQEIRTPILEKTELFHRGVGETTDIVSKEMYTFIDRGDRSVTLRPEGTAAVLRAFLENHLQQQGSIHKLYYIAPMFRYDRPQLGRYRQHHQFGVEAIGQEAAEQDVECIDLLYTLYSRLGLQNLQVQINSLGTPSCRVAFRTALTSFLMNKKNELSADSQTRLETNPLRILDSKDPKDQQLLIGAPILSDFFDQESRDHFHDVLKLLNQLQIPYLINQHLVRGLDYYNKTVFEITSSELGAQNSLGGGGRYDGLMKTLGGPDLPCFGFGSGIERILQTLIRQKSSFPSAPRPAISLIPIGEQAKNACFSLLHQLRQNEISSTMEFGNRKLGKAMQSANQAGVRWVVVMGDEELKSQRLELKEMASGSITPVNQSDLIPFIKNSLNI